MLIFFRIFEYNSSARARAFVPASHAYNYKERTKVQKNLHACKFFAKKITFLISFNDFINNHIVINHLKFYQIILVI